MEGEKKLWEAKRHYKLNNQDPNAVGRKLGARHIMNCAFLGIMPNLSSREMGSCF